MFFLKNYIFSQIYVAKLLMHQAVFLVNTNKLPFKYYFTLLFALIVVSLSHLLLPSGYKHKIVPR